MITDSKYWVIRHYRNIQDWVKGVAVRDEAQVAGRRGFERSRVRLLLRVSLAPPSRVTVTMKQLNPGEDRVRETAGSGRGQERSRPRKKEGRLGRVCVWETRPEIAVVRFCVFGSSWTCKQGRRMGKNEENRRSCFIGVLSYNGNYETVKTVRVFAFCGGDVDRTMTLRPSIKNGQF